MTVESVTYIDDLNISNPVGTDPKSEGDDHIRNIKKGIKATFPNITAAMTASHAELNIMDGVTATTAELNIMGGVTATTAELNIMDGVTATTAELNLLDGATLKHKVIDMGDWDMDADSNYSIAHGLTRTDIRSVTVLIRADGAATPNYDFNCDNHSGATDHLVLLTDTLVSLARSTSGYFDGIGFDSTSFNRGWITIWYV